MVDVEQHLPLAASCARRFFGKGMENEDVYQIACEGLLKAAARFDPARGTAFSTYAVPFILGEIKGAFRADGAIKVSRRLKELSLKIKKFSECFEQREGRSPGIGELSEMMGIDSETIVDAIDSCTRPVSIFDEQGTLVDIPCDVKCNGLDIDDSIILNKALSSLSAEMRRLYELRFICERSQADVAKVLGISQVTVSRREKSLLKRLRDFLSEEKT